MLNNLAVGYLAERQLAQAAASGEQALAVYERIGSRYGAAIAMLNLALVGELRGRLLAARDQLLPLIALCDAIGHQQIGAQARCNLGGILAELDQPQAGLDQALEGNRIAEAIGDQYILATGHGAAFAACCRLGRWEEAVIHGQRAQAGFAAHGEPRAALIARPASRGRGSRPASGGALDGVCAVRVGGGQRGLARRRARSALACTVCSKARRPARGASRAAAHHSLSTRLQPLPTPPSAPVPAVDGPSRRALQTASADPGRGGGGPALRRRRMPARLWPPPMDRRPAHPDLDAC